MPELDVVHKLSKVLRTSWVGEEIVSVSIKDSSCMMEVSSIQCFNSFVGKRVLSVDRVGKQLIVALSPPSVWRIMLNQTGWFRTSDVLNVPDHHLSSSTPTRASLHFSNGNVWEYVDSRGWGRWFLYIGEYHSKGVLDQYLLRAYDWYNHPQEASQVLLSKSSSSLVKNVLCCQGSGLGVGIMLSLEAMYLAGISPFAYWDRISQESKVLVLQKLVHVVKTALESPDYSWQQVFRKSGYSCPVCAEAGTPTLIQSVKVEGSTVFYCLGCQVVE